MYIYQRWDLSWDAVDDEAFPKVKGGSKLRIQISSVAQFVLPAREAIQLTAAQPPKTLAAKEAQSSHKCARSSRLQVAVELNVLDFIDEQGGSVLQNLDQGLGCWYGGRGRP